MEQDFGQNQHTPRNLLYLGIDLMASVQKLGIILENKMSESGGPKVKNPYSY